MCRNTSIIGNLGWLFSDAVWFPLLQIGLVLFALLAWLRDRNVVTRAGRDGLTKQPERGAESMGYFLVICGLIIALPAAICASVDLAVVKNYRALWILGDSAIVGYVCLMNGWFRNDILLRFVDYLKRIERR